MRRCVAHWPLAGTNASEARACGKLATHSVIDGRTEPKNDRPDYCLAHANDFVMKDRAAKRRSLEEARANASEAVLCEREARDKLLHAAGRPLEERWDALSQAARKWVKADNERMGASAHLRRLEEDER